VEVLGNDAGELELWMDFEDNYGGQFGGMKNWYDFAERLKALRPDKQLGVYTGYYYWLENLTPSHIYFAQYPLWIASYQTLKPRIPQTWSDWLMWQYTDKGQGNLYGVKSANIDLNYRRGEAVGQSPTKPFITADFGLQKVKYEQV
jgi:GH25 family lysozyme M1 (1,4-beta-N-acetylmuramidase)